MRESYGKIIRRRSAGNIVDEMESLLKSGVNIFTFDDDNFTTSAEHVRAICEEIISRRLQLKWIAHARVDEVSPYLLKKMKEAGCVLLRFGIESGSERILKILDKTSSPSTWLKKSADAVQQAGDTGISTACLFIIGSPTETKEDIFRSIRFAINLSPDIIQVAYFTPFPGSMAHKLYRRELEGTPLSGIYHYNSPLVNLSGMGNDELKKIQVLFYKKFLMRPVFLIRHFLNYKAFYLSNPCSLFKLLSIIKVF